MSLPLAKLGDVAEVNWGNTAITKASYIKTGYPAYSATGCDGFLPDYEHDTPGVILSAIGAKCGKCFYAYGKWTAIKNTITITPHQSEKADFRFLYYYLNREELWPKRGVGQPFIGLGDARKLLIPFPPLDQQRRIAEILDKSDALRATRRTALAQLDYITQSIFLDLFGDPASNPKGYPVRRVEEFSVRVTKGESPHWQGFGYEVNGIRFITSENVGWGKMIVNADKFISEEFHRKLVRSQVNENDLLINLVGASIGRACLAEKKFLPGNVNQAVAVVSLDAKKALPPFILEQLLTPQIQKRLLGESVEAARANVSLSNIRGLELIVPEVFLQREFARRVVVVEKLKSTQRTSLTEMDALFASLQHRAFQGQL